ncbi:hypothetical protein O3P69_018381 [Scylla paramamosain]|uniref:Uncharacterized protein n=1 Tax=Scylla paramamosain TaxID=85552 RepID=A0AAW0SAQ8_SCYPA
MINTTAQDDSLLLNVRTTPVLRCAALCCPALRLPCSVLPCVSISGIPPWRHDVYHTPAVSAAVAAKREETIEWRLTSFMDMVKCHLLMTVTGIKAMNRHQMKWNQVMNLM